MKPQTIEIEIPEGFEIDTVDKQSGKIKFKAKPKNITERIKTIEDAINELGESDEEVIVYKKLLTVFSPDSYVVNHQAVIVLVKALNEGWVPNWGNSSELKYYPYFELQSSSGFRFDDDDYWLTRSFVGSRLCLKSRELAVYAGNKFKDVYEKFMVIK